MGDSFANLASLLAQFLQGCLVSPLNHWPFPSWPDGSGSHSLGHRKTVFGVFSREIRHVFLNHSLQGEVLGDKQGSVLELPHC